MHWLLSTISAVSLISSCRAAVVDFSFYPPRSQDCLYRASNSSSCATDTVTATNTCLCGNGGDFVTNSAKCLASSDPDDLESVYKTMTTACSDSNTPLRVSEQEYMAAAAVATSSAGTSTTASSTGSTKPTGTGTTAPAKDEDQGLSGGAKIGIIAGASVAGAISVAGVAFWLIRRRRRRDNEESHPMLPQEYGAPIHSFLPGPGEAGHHSPGWTDDAKWRPTVAPGVSHTGFNWETPYDVAYGYPKPPPPPAFTPKPPRSYESPKPQVYELVGSHQLPVEVPGSTMIEMEGSPVPPQNEWRWTPGTDPRLVDASYPSQVATRPSK